VLEQLQIVPIRLHDDAQFLELEDRLTQSVGTDLLSDARPEK